MEEPVTPEIGAMAFCPQTEPASAWGRVLRCLPNAHLTGYQRRRSGVLPCWVPGHRDWLPEAESPKQRALVTVSDTAAALCPEERRLSKASEPPNCQQMRFHGRLYELP